MSANRYGGLLRLVLYLEQVDSAPPMDNKTTNTNATKLTATSATTTNTTKHPTIPHQVIVVLPPTSDLPEGDESLDGLTPPFRNARHRHFRQLPAVDRGLVQSVEDDLCVLLEG